MVNEFNPNEIVCDPGHRKQINEYALDIQDQVRMHIIEESNAIRFVKFSSYSI